MGVIGGKRIEILRLDRRGATDLVIRDEVKQKKFIVFVSKETAKQIRIVGEDLSMNPKLSRQFWKFEDERRTVEMEIVPNRFKSSLVIRTVTKDQRCWRRRVFIPEGRHGEGWLSMARQIRSVLTSGKEIADPVYPRIMPPPPPTTTIQLPPPSTPSWTRIHAQNHLLHNRFGAWEFMVVCKVERVTVDWLKIGRRLAEILQVDGEFEIFPIDYQQAIIVAASVEEREAISRAASWISIMGLPFHLWSAMMFSTIVSKFGRVEAVDEATRFCTDLTYARIKVHGNLGLMPSRMEVEDGETIHQISLSCIPEPSGNTCDRIIVSRMNQETPPVVAGENGDEEDDVEEKNTRGNVTHQKRKNVTLVPISLFDSTTDLRGNSNLNLISNLNSRKDNGLSLAGEYVCSSRHVDEADDLGIEKSRERAPTVETFDMNPNLKAKTESPSNSSRTVSREASKGAFNGGNRGILNKKTGGKVRERVFAKIS